MADATKIDVSAEDRMLRISKLIADLQEIHDRWGDTCVYVRRGGLAWGSAALNNRSDDEKNGVFDLYAEQDRERERHAGQVGRLIEDREGLRADRDSIAAKLAEVERERDEAVTSRDITASEGAKTQETYEAFRSLLFEARTDLTAAQATITKLREESEWRPIEAAPKDRTGVLVVPSVWASTPCDVATFDDDRYAKKPRPFWRRQGVSSNARDREKPPTHWRPLPTPPSEKSV